MHPRQALRNYAWTQCTCIYNGAQNVTVPARLSHAFALVFGSLGMEGVYRVNESLNST